MKWEDACLSELIDVKKGKYITKKESKEGPYPVILGGREPAYYINQFNHVGKAVVVSRSGASAGYVSFWNEPIFVTDGFLIEPKESISIDFLYYLMKSKEKQFLGLQGGSAIPHVTPKTIGGVDILLPPVDEQHRIADILSTYDNLIENNQKQIKLLEEAAQRLYKEWFVNLHFPGYEDTEIVDGIPEGWTERCVSNFGEVITGKTPSTAKTEYYGGDIPFVTIPDMHGKVFPLRTEKTLTKTGADIQKGKYLPKNTVIVSCIATVGLVNIATEICQTNQQINSVILTEEKDLYFFYESMKRIRALLDGVGSNGATMTNVNKTKFSNIKVLYPTEELVSNYYDFCLPIFNKILNLSVIMQNAQQARDRLLPKLMNGELEV